MFFGKKIKVKIFNNVAQTMVEYLIVSVLIIVSFILISELLDKAVHKYIKGILLIVYKPFP